MIIIIVVMIHHIFLKENEHQMARTNKLVQPLSGVWGMQDKSIIIIIIILMSTETEQKYYYGELNHISN